MLPPPLILLVEADAATRLVVHCALRAGRLDVVECAEADGAWALLAARRPAGVVAGRVGGEPDARALVGEMRRRGFSQPVVLLAPGGRVGKPLREAGRHLVVERAAAPARWMKDLQALLQAEPGRDEGAAAVRVGALAISPNGAAVDANGVAVALTDLEQQVLAVLVQQAGRPLRRELLLARVQDGPRMSSHAFGSLLWRVRRKLEARGAGADWLQLRAGEGYLLRLAPETGAGITAAQG